MPLIGLLRLIIALMLAMLMPALVHAASQAVTEGWEYRWGASSNTHSGIPSRVKGESPQRYSQPSVTA